METKIAFIPEIIKLIQFKDYYGVSDRIEIAKGKYLLSNKNEFLKKQLKRKIKMFKYERNKN